MQDLIKTISVIYWKILIITTSSIQWRRKESLQPPLSLVWPITSLLSSTLLFSFNTAHFSQLQFPPTEADRCILLNSELIQSLSDSFKSFLANRYAHKEIQNLIITLPLASSHLKSNERGIQHIKIPNSHINPRTNSYYTGHAHVPKLLVFSNWLLR